MSNIVIRPAEVLDAVNIVKLLRAEWQELAKDGLGVLNERKGLEWVLTSINHHFVLVADLQGRIVGTIALKPLEIPWGDGIFLGQLWFYVFPTFRKGDIAEQLARAAEALADRHGLFTMFRSEFASELPRLFEKRPGCKHTGMFYMRLPDTAAEEKRA